jgi:hypothetical protein
VPAPQCATGTERASRAGWQAPTLANEDSALGRHVPSVVPKCGPQPHGRPQAESLSKASPDRRPPPKDMIMAQPPALPEEQPGAVPKEQAQSLLRKEMPLPLADGPQPSPGVSYQQAWNAWEWQHERWQTLSLRAKGLCMWHPNNMGIDVPFAQRILSRFPEPVEPEESKYPPRPVAHCPCQCGRYVHTDNAKRPTRVEPSSRAAVFGPADAAGRGWWTCCGHCAKLQRWAMPNCPEKVWQAPMGTEGVWLCPRCAALPTTSPFLSLRPHG